MCSLKPKAKGQMLGITLGVIQNAEHWMGEGDEMIFVDDKERPKINGTRHGRLHSRTWDFGGRDAAIPFHTYMTAAPFVQLPEPQGGHYCLYR